MSIERSAESLTLAGVDPVSRRARLLEVVTAPTGEAVRFFAATEGAGSAWISRQEAEGMIEFLQDWLHSTGPSRPQR